jgi:hypothetical protein
LDPDTIRDRPETPDIDLGRVGAVPVEEIQRGVRAADLCSDHIRFVAEDGSSSLRLKAQGDVDDTELTIGPDNHEVISDGEADSMLSLSYLQDLIGSMDGMVGVRCDEELPVEFNWSRADSAVESEVLIAPRING